MWKEHELEFEVQTVWIVLKINERCAFILLLYEYYYIGIETN